MQAVVVAQADTRHTQLWGVLCFLMSLLQLLVVTQTTNTQLVWSWAQSGCNSEMKSIVS